MQQELGFRERVRACCSTMGRAEVDDVARALVSVSKERVLGLFGVAGVRRDPLDALQYMVELSTTAAGPKLSLRTLRDLLQAVPPESRVEDGVSLDPSTGHVLLSLRVRPQRRAPSPPRRAAKRDRATGTSQKRRRRRRSPRAVEEDEEARPAATYTSEQLLQLLDGDPAATPATAEASPSKKKKKRRHRKQRRSRH